MDWMLKDPTTKAEYDRYMQLRIQLAGDEEWFPVYDMGWAGDAYPYYQVTADSPRIPIERKRMPAM